MNDTYEFVKVVSGMVGIVFFMTLFIIVTAHAVWPKNREKFNSAAEIPLKED